MGRVKKEKAIVEEEIEITEDVVETEEKDSKKRAPTKYIHISGDYYIRPNTSPRCLDLVKKTISEKSGEVYKPIAYGYNTLLSLLGKYVNSVMHDAILDEKVTSLNELLEEYKKIYYDINNLLSPLGEVTKGMKAIDSERILTSSNLEAVKKRDEMYEPITSNKSTKKQSPIKNKEDSVETKRGRSKK